MTGLGYGAGIFFFAVGYTAFLLGGLTIVARRWGEAAVGPWIAFGVVLLVLLLRRFRPPGGLMQVRSCQEPVGPQNSGRSSSGTTRSSVPSGGNTVNSDTRARWL